MQEEDLPKYRHQLAAGLRLLGFKSRSMLKHYHQLRSPTFVYPDERSMSGSTQTFIAFHAAMLKKQKMAICSFVRTRAAEPRLVALLPQEEEVDAFGVQVSQQLPDLAMISNACYAGITQCCSCLRQCLPESRWVFCGCCGLWGCTCFATATHHKPFSVQHDSSATFRTAFHYPGRQHFLLQHFCDLGQSMWHCCSYPTHRHAHITLCTPATPWG